MIFPTNVITFFFITYFRDTIKKRLTLQHKVLNIIHPCWIIEYHTQFLTRGFDDFDSKVKSIKEPQSNR